MSASILVQSPSMRHALTLQQGSSQERVVTASVDIMADRRQLLHALTLPEYLEAWMTPADADTQSERIAIRSGTAFAIDYRDLHGQSITIEGVFRKATRDRVTFTYRRCRPAKTRQSIVNIWLNGNFASTRLALRHVGVMDEREYCWARDLWDFSLCRLKSLIEFGRGNAFEPTSTRCSYRGEIR